jgi:hypothetical protein
MIHLWRRLRKSQNVESACRDHLNFSQSKQFMMAIGGLKRIRYRHNVAVKAPQETQEKPKRITELESLLVECGVHYEKLIKYQQHKIDVIRNNLSTVPFLTNSIDPMINELCVMENRLNNIKKLVGSSGPPSS